MKFTWLSNASWAATGYGDQTKLIVDGLKKRGHEPAIISFYGLQGGILNWGGVPVFPNGHMPYGQDIAAAHTVQYGARYLFSLVDAWVFNNTPFYDALQKDRIRWIPYFPIDSEPLPPFVKIAVERAYKRIVFSKFACRMMDNAGLEYTYIPHCIDTEELKPKDRIQSRQLMKTQGLTIPNDAFIVGMVAANKGAPSRKAFSRHIEAFAKFKKKHSDAVFYIHTSTGERGEYGGENLLEQCRFYGLTVNKDVFFPDAYSYYLGFPKNYLAHIYSMMNVHILVSSGEGFGIPTIEAQACGVPVIVGDWTAMPELCKTGQIVPKEESDAVWTPVAALQYAPRVDAIVEALERAYNENRDPQQVRERVLEYAASSVVDKYWMPYLKQLEEDDKATQDEITASRQMAGRRLVINE